MSDTSIPKNFSWLEDGKIAALAFPHKREDFEYLAHHGIRYLVTLTRELKPEIQQCPSLIGVDIGVEDYCTFTLEQVQQFVNICEKALNEGQGVAVHCRAGIGRTGTLLACYLVRFRGMRPHEAIRRVRSARPGSIETTAQEQTVSDYYNHLNDIIRDRGECGFVVATLRSYADDVIQTAVSNSPSPVKRLSTNAQSAFDRAGELYSLVQKWNLLNSSGAAVVSSLCQLKVHTWDNPAESGEGTNVRLQSLCDQLASIVNEMEDMVKLMEEVQKKYLALAKLEGVQQSKSGTNQTPDNFLFLTWPVERFGRVAANITKSYAEELRVKRCIAENVAHCEERRTLDLHSIAWVHQAHITPLVKLELEALLVETGQR